MDPPHQNDHIPVKSNMWKFWIPLMNVDHFWITLNNVTFCCPNLSSVFDLGIVTLELLPPSRMMIIVLTISGLCARNVTMKRPPSGLLGLNPTHSGDTQLGCIPGLLTVRGPRGVIPQPPAEKLGTGAQACHASNIFSSHVLWGKNSVFPNILLNQIFPPSSIFISWQENFQITALLLSHLWTLEKYEEEVKLRNWY